jgi:hypothetical protein
VCCEPLWVVIRQSSTTTASPSPADIRHDNQSPHSGPHAGDVRSLPAFAKIADGRVAHHRPRDVADGRWSDGRVPRRLAKIESLVPSRSSQPCPRRPQRVCGVAFARLNIARRGTAVPFASGSSRSLCDLPLRPLRLDRPTPKVRLLPGGASTAPTPFFDILLKAPHRRSNRVQFPPFDTLLSVPLCVV